jgi:hypothetical protein
LRVIKYIMPASCIVVKFDCESLAALHAALMEHAERLNSLLEPSWPDAEEVQGEMYALVGTLKAHRVDQKWFSAFARVGEVEEMVTTQEICAVSWCSLLLLLHYFLTKDFISSFPQAAGNAVISCIDAAHTKYELNPLDWQQVVEIGWCLLTKQDMGRFKEMCMEGDLGPRDYGLFEDWLAIDGSREAYIRIRDGLVLEGEIFEMNDKENFYNEGPFQACVRGFFLAYHQVVAYYWWLSFRPTDLERYCKFEVSFGAGNVYCSLVGFPFFYLIDGNFSFGMRIRQA